MTSDEPISSFLSSIGSYFGGTTAAGASAYGAAGTTYAAPAALAADTGFTAATAAEAGAYGAGATTGLTAAEIAQYGSAALQLAGKGIQTGAEAAQSAQQAKLGQQEAVDIQNERMLAKRAEAYNYRALTGANRATAAGTGLNPFSGSPLENELNSAFQFGQNQAASDYGTQLRVNNALRGAAYQRGRVPGIVAGGALQGASTLGKLYYNYKTPYNWLNT